MLLKQFIETFICKNSLIRLWYTYNGGHKCVIQSDKDSVCMEWEIIKGNNLYNKYKNYKVIGITDICTDGTSPEAINIVIETKEDYRERALKKLIK